MIAKISRGVSAAGLASYLHGPGKANEHVYEGRLGGAVIGGSLAHDGARDGAGWAADMAAAMQARPEVSRPVWHMSLRAAPGDRRLSDAEWADAAQLMGERMGWSEHPWVVVRHGEDHVHVVVSRVGWDGTLWAGRHDRWEAMRARQEVEKQYGLTQAPTRSPGGSLSPGEVAKGLRTGKAPERETLAGHVRAAAGAAKGLGREGFEAALDAAGVRWRVAQASTGRVSGYSLHLPGHLDAQGREVWWKASQLGRDLGWKALSRHLEAPLPEPVVSVPPRKFLESAKRYDERVEGVRRDARLRERAARLKAVSEQTRAPKGRPGASLRWAMRRQQSVRTTLPAARAELAARYGAQELTAWGLTPRPGGHPVGKAAQLAEAYDAARIARIGQPAWPRQRPSMTPTPTARPSLRLIRDNPKEVGGQRWLGR